MMNGNQYRESLSDGRATYFEGRKVDDLPNHPILGVCVDDVATVYDRFYSPEPEARSPLMTIPKSAEELRERIPLLHEAGMMAHVTYTSIMTLTTAAGRIQGKVDPEYLHRLSDFVDECQANDVRITQCITDSKGDRSRPPHLQDDPDQYTRVVERRKDGVVIRGAKLHITGASFGHELMTIPTKNMKGGEEDYSIACSVPVNAPGVKIVNTTYAPRHEDLRDFLSGLRRSTTIPEGFVIFDDVFVPNDRIFLDGEFTLRGGVRALAGPLGATGWSSPAWPTAPTSSWGFAQLIAEANGLAHVSHIKREDLRDDHPRHPRARPRSRPRSANCELRASDGAVVPQRALHQRRQVPRRRQLQRHGAPPARHLRRLGAHRAVDLRPREPGDGRSRAQVHGHDGGRGRRVPYARLFHAIRDLTADSYGGWRQVTNIQAGGGLYAQRIVTRKHYDLERAKRMALHHAGMDEDDVVS